MALNVSQLIDALSKLDPEMQIGVGCRPIEEASPEFMSYEPIDTVNECVWCDDLDCAFPVDDDYSETWGTDLSDRHRVKSLRKDQKLAIIWLTNCGN